MTDDNTTTAASTSAEPAKMLETTKLGAAIDIASPAVATEKASPADAPSSQKNDVSIEDAPGRS